METLFHKPKTDKSAEVKVEVDTSTTTYYINSTQLQFDNIVVGHDDIVMYVNDTAYYFDSECQVHACYKILCKAFIPAKYANLQKTRSIIYFDEDTNHYYMIRLQSTIKFNKLSSVGKTRQTTNIVLCIGNAIRVAILLSDVDEQHRTFYELCKIMYIKNAHKHTKTYKIFNNTILVTINHTTICMTNSSHGIQLQFPVSITENSDPENGYSIKLKEPNRMHAIKLSCGNVQEYTLILSSIINHCYSKVIILYKDNAVIFGTLTDTYVYVKWRNKHFVIYKSDWAYTIVNGVVRITSTTTGITTALLNHKEEFITYLSAYWPSK